MSKKFVLSEKRIDVPTLNEEHKYYYPEEVIKEFIEILIEEIKNLENQYPKDIFLWDNQEGCDFTRGRFNQFIFQVAENTKENIIKIILEMKLIKE